MLTGFTRRNFGGVVALVVAVGLSPSDACAQTVFFGPTPYLCAGDSPFNGVSFTYFHRETFEDHLFNVPGVTASAGGVTSVIFGPGGHDSVDCDDGLIDGLGLGGDSFFSSAVPNILFTFSAGVLGTLPTHAGLVWTDGGPFAVITLEAFDAAGVSLGTRTGMHADGSNLGTTGEDRFYGVAHAAGISAIRISHTSGGLEIDHLQYGAARACSADFNNDGDVGTDADIESFFGCLAGNCCATCQTADFNGDGDVGTDADIEAFFRVLAGGNC